MISTTKPFIMVHLLNATQPYSIALDYFRAEYFILVPKHKCTWTDCLPHSAWWCFNYFRAILGATFHKRYTHRNAENISRTTNYGASTIFTYFRHANSLANFTRTSVLVYFRCLGFFSWLFFFGKPCWSVVMGWWCFDAELWVPAKIDTFVL